MCVFLIASAKHKSSLHKIIVFNTVQYNPLIANRSPYIPSNKRVMLQATNAGIAIEFFEDLKEFVNYRSNIPVNDGQWHHVSLVWDSSAGTLTLTTDAVVVAQVEGYAEGRQLPM